MVGVDRGGLAEVWVVGVGGVGFVERLFMLAFLRRDGAGVAAIEVECADLIMGCTSPAVAGVAALMSGITPPASSNSTTSPLAMAAASWLANPRPCAIRQ